MRNTRAVNNKRINPSARQMTYVEGNTVRKIRPEHAPAGRIKKDPAAVRREQIRIAKNREKALAMDVPYLMVLTAAVIITLYICYSYLCLQSSISSHMENVEQLETRYETLKAENDALESSRNTSVALNYVYNVAINELGMVHAGKDSIINFDKTESEYVRQYEDIPE